MQSNKIDPNNIPKMNINELISVMSNLSLYS